MPTSADIELLSTWLAATDISTLELHEASAILRLERRDGQVSVNSTLPDTAETSMDRAETILADSPGIFLHAHPLRTDPLVDVGAEAQQGQVIALLRIGALLLPIRASQTGRIEGYWTEDGAAVEYGTPLIELQACKGAG